MRGRRVEPVSMRAPRHPEKLHDGHADETEKQRDDEDATQKKDDEVAPAKRPGDVFELVIHESSFRYELLQLGRRRAPHKSPGIRWRSYAGSAKSSLRMTLIRCPSRIVIVGRTFRNRSRIRVADVDKLCETPCR